MTKPTERIFEVQALRGLAALCVAWGHFTGGLPPSWIQDFQWWMPGVDTFFVISGFIIPYSLHVSGYELRFYPRFILRRLVRLEPPYLCSIVLVIFLYQLTRIVPIQTTPPPSFTIPQLASHLFYLVPLTSYDWIQGPYWTLAYEFAFYLCIGLIWPFISRKPIFLTLALAIVISGAATMLGGQNDRWPIHSNAAPFLFLIGIAGMRYFVGVDNLRSAASVTIFAAILYWYFTGDANSTFVSVASIIIIVFIKIPRSNILNFLGDVSYSLYLLHMPIGIRVVNLGKRLTDSPLMEFGLCLIALGASIGAAVIWWRYIERPAKLASQAMRIGNDSASM